MHGVSIDDVLTQILIDARQALVPIIGFLVQTTVEQPHKGEVHHCGQLGVILGHRRVLLPIAHADVVVYPRFSHNIEVGIFFQHGLIPPRHGCPVGIGVSVLPYAVDAGVFHPPDGVLDEVLDQVRVTLVQIGHDLNKPSVLGIDAVGFHSVRIAHSGNAVACLNILALVVEPRVVGSVGEKEVLGAAMVEHHVLHYLQSLGVCLLHKLAVSLVASIAGVNFVIVGDGITMVGVRRHIVDLQRRGPDSSYTKVGQVVQCRRHAFQVATMAGIRLLS